MQKTKKLLLTSFTAVLLISLLSGCNFTSGPNSSTTPGEASPSPSASVSPPPQTSGVSQDDKDNALKELGNVQKALGTLETFNDDFNPEQKDKTKYKTAKQNVDQVFTAYQTFKTNLPQSVKDNQGVQALISPENSANNQGLKILNQSDQENKDRKILSLLATATDTEQKSNDGGGNAPTTDDVKNAWIKAQQELLKTDYVTAEDKQKTNPKFDDGSEGKGTRTATKKLLKKLVSDVKADVNRLETSITNITIAASAPSPTSSVTPIRTPTPTPNNGGINNPIPSSFGWWRDVVLYILLAGVIYSYFRLWDKNQGVIFVYRAKTSENDSEIKIIEQLRQDREKLKATIRELSALIENHYKSDNFFQKIFNIFSTTEEAEETQQEEQALEHPPQEILDKLEEIEKCLDKIYQGAVLVRSAELENITAQRFRQIINNVQVDEVINEIKNKTTDLEDTIRHTLEGINNQTNESKNSITNTLKKITQKLNDIEDSIAKFNETIQDTSYNPQSQEQGQPLSHELTVLSRNINQLRDDVSNMVNLLQSVINDSERGSNPPANLLGQIRTEILHLLPRSPSYESLQELSTVKAENDRLIREKHQLEWDKDELQRQQENLRTQFNRVNEGKHQLEVDKSNLEIQILQENTRNTEKIRELQNQLKQVEDQRQKYEEESRTLREELALSQDSKKKIENLNELYEYSQKQCQKKEDEVNKLTQDKQQLEDEQDRLNCRLSSLEETSKQLAQEKANLQDEIAKKRDENDHLKDRVKRLQSALDKQAPETEDILSKWSRLITDYMKSPEFICNYGTIEGEVLEDEDAYNERVNNATGSSKSVILKKTKIDGEYYVIKYGSDYLLFPKEHEIFQSQIYTAGALFEGCKTGKFTSIIPAQVTPHGSGMWQLQNKGRLEYDS